MSHRIRRHIANNVVGYVALFFALCAGAYAAGLAPDSVRSQHIKDGQVRAADLADDTTPFALTGLDIKNDSMGGHDIIDGNVTGLDVQESSLGEVPAAAQGGTGRYAFEGSCDPEVAAGEVYSRWENCAFVPAALATPGRLLIMGQVQGMPDDNEEIGGGSCRLEINGQPIAASSTFFAWEEGAVRDEANHATLTAVTGVLPAGNPVVGIECQERHNPNGTFRATLARVSAVSLSAN